MNTDELKSRRLRLWCAEGHAPPLTLFAQLTERCTCRCPSCHYTEDRIFPEDTELPDDRWLAVVREAATMGVEQVYLVGGEIYHRPRLMRLLPPLVRALNLYGDFTTNGLEWEERDLHLLVETAWDRVVVSLDSAKATRHDALRRCPGGWATAVKNLGRLAELRRSSTGKPRLGINSVVSAMNIDAVAGLARLAADMGLDEIYFLPVAPISTWARKHQLDAGHLALLREQVVQARRIVEAHPGLSHNLDELDRANFTLSYGAAAPPALPQEAEPVADPFWRALCFVPFHQLVVYPDGTASTCWMHQADYRENVRRRSLSDIWHGEVFTRLRDEMRGETMPEYCRRCCAAYLEENRRLRNSR